jgi:HD-like signal output (HDOD) protein
MPSCLLMSNHEREAQVLNLGLSQSGVQVVRSKADYKNYTLSLQYQPDFLLMELPKVCTEEMYIAGLIKKHPRFRKLPIIGYGDPVEAAVKKGITSGGFSAYLERPLKFSDILELIDKILNTASKPLAAGAPKSEEKKKVDYDKILSPATPASEKIETMTLYVSRLMAFPFTIAKVLRITNDEKSGAGHLSQAISVDPNITTNILKVSNSVFFVSSNRRISSIKEAIVRIGFAETKKIVMGMMVPKMLSETIKSLGFNRMDFWHHSLAAGLFAEKLAKFMTDLTPEMAFLAGLLHDIGIIIIDEFFPDFFAASLKETSAHSSHFPEEQTALFGMDHKDLIAKLFPTWKMPQELTNAIINQFHCADAVDKVDTMEKKLTLCVMLGNILAKVAHFGRECDQFVWPIENWVFEQTHIGSIITEKFIEDVHQGIIKYSSFLGLEQCDYTMDLKSKADAADFRIGILNTADHIFIPAELYLQSKGYCVERIIEPESKTAEQSKKFSLVIVWAGSVAITSEYVAAHAHFAHYQKGPKVETTNVEHAPVLLLVAPDFGSADSFAPEISLMSNRFDLRELDNTIEKILLGKSVRVLPAPAAPKPIPPEKEQIVEPSSAAPTQKPEGSGQKSAISGQKSEEKR